MGALFLKCVCRLHINFLMSVHRKLIGYVKTQNLKFSFGHIELYCTRMNDGCVVFISPPLNIIEAAITVKVSSYIAQSPILRTAQSTLHFAPDRTVHSNTKSTSLWKH